MGVVKEVNLVTGTQSKNETLPGGSEFILTNRLCRHSVRQQRRNPKKKSREGEESMLNFKPTLKGTNRTIECLTAAAILRLLGAFSEWHSLSLFLSLSVSRFGNAV